MIFIATLSLRLMEFVSVDNWHWLFSRVDVLYQQNFKLILYDNMSLVIYTENIFGNLAAHILDLMTEVTNQTNNNED